MLYDHTLRLWSHTIVSILHSVQLLALKFTILEHLGTRLKIGCGALGQARPWWRAGPVAQLVRARA